MNTTDITDALRDAKDLILAGDSLDAAAAASAADYDLNPGLVARKLCEQHGVGADVLADTLRQRARDASSTKIDWDARRREQDAERAAAEARAREEERRLCLAIIDYFRENPLPLSARVRSRY